MRGCYEPTLEDLFADAALRQLMARDGVSETALRALLGEVWRSRELTSCGTAASCPTSAL
jgi:hypothetical protein